MRKSHLKRWFSFGIQKVCIMVADAVNLHFRISNHFHVVFSRNCIIRNFWIFFRTCFPYSRTRIYNFIELFPCIFEKTRPKNHVLVAISTNHLYSGWKSIIWIHGFHWSFQWLARIIIPECSGMLAERRSLFLCCVFRQEYT